MKQNARIQPSRIRTSVRHPGAREAVRQGGAVSLLVVLVLLIALTLIVLAMGRVGVQEQTISGNEQRSLKAIDAAQAGVEYGMNWLARNLDGLDAEYLLDGTCACWPKTLTVPSDVTPGTGETYRVRVTVTPQGTDSYSPYSGSCSSCTTPVAGPYLEVSAKADDANDASVTATVEQLAMNNADFTSKSGGSPPLVLRGCFTDKTTGGPDVYPPYTGPYAGDAISAGDTAKLLVPDCVSDGIDPLAMCDCPEDPGDAPHIETHSGDVDNPLDFTNPNAAWESIFPDYSKAQFFRDAAGEEALVSAGRMSTAERTYILIDSVADATALGTTVNNWHTDLGSGILPGNETPSKPCGTPGGPSYTPPELTHPVILYFDSDVVGCPKLNSGVTIWGIVYIKNCALDGNGWGGGTVYGTVAIESDMETLNANAHVCGTDETVGGGKNSSYNQLFVRIPGTWNDDI